MQIVSQGNDYIVQFDLYSDLTNIANNVVGNLTYNNTQLTLVSMTVTPITGVQSTLNANQYLFGTVLPNKHYAVACVFTVLQESPLIPVTWTISTSNPETTLVNNSKTINLVDYLDGLLASDICSNLQGCVVSARVRFLQVLPSGEWLWENYNPVGNIQLSTFTTPAIVANTVSSPTGSVDVVLNGNNYELEIDQNIPIFSTYAAAFAALGAGKKFRYSTTNTEGVPSPNNSTLAFT